MSATAYCPDDDVTLSICPVSVRLNTSVPSTLLSRENAVYSSLFIFGICAILKIYADVRNFNFV